MSFIPAIDVSEYQGDINWATISEPIAMIKMSGGDNGLYLDSHATKNYDGATAAGKAVGGYHFAGGLDPNQEADFFLQAMSPVAENDVYALDWEIQHDNPVQWVEEFMNRVHNAINVWPLLYLNLATLHAYDWSPVLQHCGLWLADWAVSPDATISTHYAYVMQQYNNGPWCDHDAWFGTIEQFKAYGYHVPVKSPSLPTPPATITPPTPSDSAPVLGQGSGTNNEQSPPTTNPQQTLTPSNSPAPTSARTSSTPPNNSTSTLSPGSWWTRLWRTIARWLHLKG